MGLTFQYEFRAPADRTAAELAAFLHKVEIEAQQLGFAPTAVINVPFDNAERVEFSRRLSRRFWVQDDRLKSTAPVAVAQYMREVGMCSLPPLRGVVLVVTDERGHEACFGFMQYADCVRSAEGGVVAESGLSGGWAFQDLVQTPDTRYRKLVKMFQDERYLYRFDDDYATWPTL